MADVSRIRQQLEAVTATPSGVEKLVAECLETIRLRDARLRCMVHVDSEGALRQAARLNEFLHSGRAPLPLHGIPVVIKEIFSITGMPDSCGSRLQLPGLFSAEGPFIQRLRALGCVILGKSYSTEFALSQINLDRAMPVNPRDETADRLTGGSSSGSAAALAAGYCGLAIGTDTGGSVRAPAALCGIAGFKPSHGVWSMDGVVPLFPRFDTPGIFTDTAAELLQVHHLLVPGFADAAVELQNLRIGVPRELFFDDLDANVTDAIRHALTALESAGVNLVPFNLPDLQAVERYFRLHLPSSMLGYLHQNVPADQWRLLDTVTKKRLQGAAEVVGDAAAHDAIGTAQQCAIAAVARARLDAWITPTVPCVAPIQDALVDVEAVMEWQSYVSRNTRCINALDMPACTLPVPLESASLPVGLQVVGRNGDDSRTLAIAAALERALKPSAV